MRAFHSILTKRTDIHPSLKKFQSYFFWGNFNPSYIPGQVHVDIEVSVAG